MKFSLKENIQFSMKTKDNLSFFLNYLNENFVRR